MPTLSGFVEDATGSPATRIVRAYRRSDGMLAGTAVSSWVDGTFSVNAYDGSAHYVVCLDDGTPDENAQIARSVLNGEKGPRRDVILLNTALCLYMFHDNITLRDCVNLAADLIDSGKASDQLKSFIRLSNEVV